jgi:hypothetical protein
MSRPRDLEGFVEFGRSISGYAISKCALCNQTINPSARVVWLRDWHSGLTVHERCYDVYQVVAVVPHKGADGD